jgi:hypothetical protein
MRKAEKSTCSAIGNSFEFFLDARISKSISNLASRERMGKPAFLITRMAQSRRENINLFPAKSLRCGVQCLSHIPVLLDKGTSLRLRDPVLLREIRDLLGLACRYPATIRRSAFRFVVRHVAPRKGRMGWGPLHGNSLLGHIPGIAGDRVARMRVLASGVPASAAQRSRALGCFGLQARGSACPRVQFK